LYTLPKMLFHRSASIHHKNFVIATTFHHSRTVMLVDNQGLQLKVAIADMLIMLIITIIMLTLTESAPAQMFARQ